MLGEMEAETTGGAVRLLVGMVGMVALPLVGTTAHPPVEMTEVGEEGAPPEALEMLPLDSRTPQRGQTEPFLAQVQDEIPTVTTSSGALFPRLLQTFRSLASPAHIHHDHHPMHHSLVRRRYNDRHLKLAPAPRWCHKLTASAVNPPWREPSRKNAQTKAVGSGDAQNRRTASVVSSNGLMNFRKKIT